MCEPRSSVKTWQGSANIILLVLCDVLQDILLLNLPRTNMETGQHTARNQVNANLFAEGIKFTIEGAGQSVAILCWYESSPSSWLYWNVTQLLGVSTGTITDFTLPLDFTHEISYLQYYVSTDNVLQANVVSSQSCSFRIRSAFVWMEVKKFGQSVSNCIVSRAALKLFQCRYSNFGLFNFVQLNDRRHDHWMNDKRQDLLEMISPSQTVQNDWPARRTKWRTA